MEEWRQATGSERERVLSLGGYVWGRADRRTDRSRLRVSIDGSIVPYPGTTHAHVPQGQERDKRQNSTALQLLSIAREEEATTAARMPPDMHFISKLLDASKMCFQCVSNVFPISQLM